MTVEFIERDRAWPRRPGRPRRQVPAEVMEMLWRTYNTATAAVLPVADSTSDEIRDFKGLLVRGAKDAGLRLRCKVEDGNLVFSMVDPSWVRKAASDG